MAKNSPDFLEDFLEQTIKGKIKKSRKSMINPWAAVEAQLKRFRKCWDRAASVHKQMFPFSLRFAQNKTNVFFLKIDHPALKRDEGI